MNLKDFEYIAEIAKQGNISKAASRLYITQPALSRFLQRTEEELGTPLFYKTGKHVIPTKAGECYLEYARKILELNIHMEEDIRRIISRSHRMIRIGASAGRGEYLASWVLPLFHRKYPEYQTSLTLNTRQVLMQKLEERELDVIFVNVAVEAPGYFYEKIAVEDMVLLVYDGHFLMKESQNRDGYRYPWVDMRLWKDCPFVYPSKVMNTGQFIYRYFDECGCHPPMVSEVESINLIFSAVESKMGIAIVPSMPHPSVFAGRLHYLSLEGDVTQDWGFCAVQKANADVPDGIDDLLETARLVYRTIVG